MLAASHDQCVGAVSTGKQGSFTRGVQGVVVATSLQVGAVSVRLKRVVRLATSDALVTVVVVEVVADNAVVLKRQYVRPGQNGAVCQLHAGQECCPAVKASAIGRIQAQGIIATDANHNLRGQGRVVVKFHVAAHLHGDVGQRDASTQHDEIRGPSRQVDRVQSITTFQHIGIGA